MTFSRLAVFGLLITRIWAQPTVSLTPWEGAGPAATISVGGAHPGYTIQTIYLSITPAGATTGTTDCEVAVTTYNNPLYGNTLWLYDPGISGWLTTPVGQGSLGSSTTNCTLNGAASTYSGPDYNILATFAVTLSSGYTGPKASWAAAISDAPSGSNNSGWQRLGVWSPQVFPTAIYENLGGVNFSQYLSSNNGAAGCEPFGQSDTTQHCYQRIFQGLHANGVTGVRLFFDFCSSQNQILSHCDQVSWPNHLDSIQPWLTNYQAFMQDLYNAGIY